MDDIEARLIGVFPFIEERTIEGGSKSSVTSSSPFTLATVEATELRVRRIVVDT